MMKIPRTNLKHEYSRYFRPVATVELGEEVIIETEDAYNGNLNTSDDIAKLIAPNALPPNPVTGPICVKGTEPGDILVVAIDDIFLADVGGTCFARIGHSPINSWFDIDYARLYAIRDGKVKFSERLEVPADPFVGCLATAPAYGAPASTERSQSGGNMDCCHAKPGAKVYLPVSVAGSYFYIGDVHALQGDGEYCDTAVETRAEVRLHFEVIRASEGCRLGCPRIETPELLVTVAGGPSLDECFRVAMLEMLAWLETEYGLRRQDVFLELTQVANLRPCNRVTGRCEVPKWFLKI